MLYVNPLATPYEVSTTRVMEDPFSRPMDAQRRQAALQELEHYFLFLLLQEMRKSVPQSGLLRDGFETRMYEQLLDDAFAKQAARSGQLGIAKLVDEQLRIRDLQPRLADLEGVSAPSATGGPAHILAP